MNKELRPELETQWDILETMRAEMETFNGKQSTTGGGGKPFKMVCFHCGMPGREEVLPVERSLSD
jgi:hypothetical protein